jgi:hypothetical protein
MIEINCGKAKNGNEVILKKDDSQKDPCFNILAGGVRVGKICYDDFGGVATDILEGSHRKGYGKLAWIFFVDYLFSDLLNEEPCLSIPMTTEGVLFRKSLGFEEKVELNKRYFTTREIFYKKFGEFFEEREPANNSFELNKITDSNLELH